MKDHLYSFYILHSRKYKENTLLVSIFTEEFGKLSGILSINKKKANLYQPLVKLKGQIAFSKRESSLNRIYSIEFVESFYQENYINLLSLQYMNELLYLLLSYSHEEKRLFKKYAFILKNINESNYKYLLRFFELELLETLGQGLYVDCDIGGDKIKAESSYQILPSGFKKVLDSSLRTVLGKNLLKISDPMSTWTAFDLKEISRVVRVYIDSILGSKQLKSRELLVDFLRLQR